MEINYHQGIAENLPYEDDLFDVVVCVDVLEHVSDLGKTIAEAKRVLKKNGTFLFDTINKTDESKMTMITLMEDTLNIIPKGGHDWDKFIEPEKLKNILINAGFSEIEFKGFQVKGQNAETGKLEVEINDNLSVVYIGKANG